jgi:hypothetical protein
MKVRRSLTVLIAAFFLALAIPGYALKAAPVVMADGGLFDAQFYAQTYPDVVAVFGTDANWLYLHYVLAGKAEGRLPYAPGSAGAPAQASAGDFDAAYYAARYPDVAMAFGYDPTLLKMHYDLCGKLEGRFPNAAAEMGLASASVTAVPVATATATPTVEMQVLNIVNAERAKYGLAPLSWDPVNLAPGAALRAQEISVYFDHTRPNGTSCFTVVTNPGALGENIAAGQRSPEEVMVDWMNSPGHRSNILNAGFTKLGVGYYYNAQAPYRYYWVQMFSS